ncbi:hypothetical protein FRC14_002019, partial [Serendipita sp. 396]
MNKMFNQLTLFCLLPIFLVTAVDSSVPCTSGSCIYSGGDGTDTAYSVLSINTENPTSLSDITTAAASKRSLVSIRHATRSGQANAVIRDFIEASKKRSSTKVSRGFLGSIGGAFNSAVDTVSGVVDDAKDAITGAGEQVGDTLHDVGNTIQDGIEDAVDTVQDGINQAGDTIGQVVDSATGAVEAFVHSLDDATSFNETISRTLNVIDVDQLFPVFSASVDCPGQGPIPAIQTSVSVTAAVKAKLQADVGFIVTGSIVPPQIDDLAFTSLLHGNIGASFRVKAGAKGTFDTGLIPLVEAGLPGLSFPGILSIGPKLSLNAQGKASLGVIANVTISSSLDLPEVNLIFPPSQGQSVAQVVPGSTPVQVDVGGSVELKGRAELHIVPRLEIGVEILSGAAETTVFLNVDNSAGVDFTLSAGAELTPVSGTLEQPVVDLADVQTKFGGSIGADVGVSIDAGAKASLLPFFDQTVSVNLFSKTFPIFKKSFGNSVKRRSLLVARAEESGGLNCPLSAEVNVQQPIFNE